MECENDDGQKFVEMVDALRAATKRARISITRGLDAAERTLAELQIARNHRREVVFAKAMEVFGHPDIVMRWLIAESSALGGKSPMEIIEIGEGSRPF